MAYKELQDVGMDLDLLTERKLKGYHTHHTQIIYTNNHIYTHIYIHIYKQIKLYIKRNKYTTKNIPIYMHKNNKKTKTIIYTHNTHTQQQEQTYAVLHTNKYINIHSLTNKPIGTNTPSFNLFLTHRQRNMHNHKHKHKNIFMYTHTHIHRETHTQTHTYTHIHIKARKIQTQTQTHRYKKNHRYIKNK